ncbi:DUF2185 domain-containing protein [Microbacterium sp. KR10-403]|uniref:DUF2185 domain-containing protein n=1 Tax=Microbacterium sp. KR10-403 TaxID=3158581 RepID=UPI0032E3C204
MSTPDFVQNSGGCVVSKNILSGRGRLTWLVREPSTNPADNGWRFLSDIDDDEYLADPNNMAVATFNQVAEIEPAIIGIYALPVGSDLQLVVENGRRRFYDNNTGQVVDIH